MTARQASTYSPFYWSSVRDSQTSSLPFLLPTSNHPTLMNMHDKRPEIGISLPTTDLAYYYPVGVPNECDSVPAPLLQVYAHTEHI